jgi:hypothetical protein
LCGQAEKQKIDGGYSETAEVLTNQLSSNAFGSKRQAIS